MNNRFGHKLTSKQAFDATVLYENETIFNFEVYTYYYVFETIDVSLGDGSEYHIEIMAAILDLSIKPKKISQDLIKSNSTKCRLPRPFARETTVVDQRNAVVLKITLGIFPIRQT